MNANLINRFLSDQRLPDSYRLDIDGYFNHLARQLQETLNRRDQSMSPLVVGINGAQGTGKSTLARFLQLAMENPQHGVAKKTAILSIDDFYLSRAKRLQLAREVHPLLVTRGVPGTHDVEQALKTVQELLTSGPETVVELPRFNKATDNPVQLQDWPLVRGPVDLILLEGWFVGAVPQSVKDLSTAINRLEEEKDGNGGWRRYVNQQLAGAYQDLFRQLDFLIMLKAPDFAQVLQWRTVQEQKLQQQYPGTETQVMSPQQLAEFVQYFQRLTMHCLETLPQAADLVLLLDEQHRIMDVVAKGQERWAECESLVGLKDDGLM